MLNYTKYFETTSIFGQNETDLATVRILHTSERSLDQIYVVNHCGLLHYNWARVRGVS
jgi:hypothetical protein